MTPLYLAATAGQRAVVEVLLDANADIGKSTVRAALPAAAVASRHGLHNRGHTWGGHCVCSAEDAGGGRQLRGPG